MPQGRIRAGRARDGDNEAPRRGTRSEDMNLPGLRLSRADLGTIVAVIDAQTDSFVILASLAGLDSALDFRGADLRGIAFGTDDLTGFDFSGADLTGADLSRAAGI